MKILIIGGTGLISTSITRILLERGDDVTLYNRGQHEARFPKGAHIIQGDRKYFSTFEKQIAEAGTFDCAIDMVCFHPDEAQSAVRAFKGRISQFIFCSTVDVYTKPATRLPYTESEPRYGITDYARNKILCEDIFTDAHSRGDFVTTIIRPAATYGEGGTIIHTFGWNTTYIDRIRKGKPIVVHGDGSSLWVMCHVDDCARAFIGAAGNPKAFGRAYHATGEEWLTWNRFHQIVADALEAPPPTLVHIPADLLYKVAPKKSAITYFNFQYANVYDNSAAKYDLNFRYTIPFIEGAHRTVAWLDKKGLVKNSDDDPFDDRIITAWENLRAGFVHELAGLEEGLAVD